MTEVLSILLQILVTLLPQILSTAGVTDATIKLLVGIVPLVIQEAEDLLPMVQNVITALMSKGDLSQEDWDTLAQLNAQVDAAFDAAIAKKG